MEKVFRMHALGADYGDCLWVEYGSERAPRRILIDAGTAATLGRLRPHLEAVRSGRPSHELLVVTHIDDDHIAGCVKLLGDPELVGQFRHVWFNGYKHLVQAWGDEETFGPVKGEQLTEAIESSGIEWNHHFGGKAAVRFDGEQPGTVKLPGGARLTILSPSVQELKRLLPVWRKVVTAAGLVPGGVAKRDPDTEDEESLGVINIDKLAAAVTKEDSAEANGSSIALLMEYEGKRILFAADAHPKVLLEGIKAFTGGERLKVDVFKLPHHGSKSNVTVELLDAIDAKVVVFSSNGRRFNHPDREAVARVIKRFSPEVKLCFNYDTEFTSPWRNASLQEKWGYKVEYGADDAGISVHLL